VIHRVNKVYRTVDSISEQAKPERRGETPFRKKCFPYAVIFRIVPIFVTGSEKKGNHRDTEKEKQGNDRLECFVNA
jgi:hypothetical protein